jgi:hypothetical protein
VGGLSFASFESPNIAMTAIAHWASKERSICYCKSNEGIKFLEISTYLPTDFIDIPFFLIYHSTLNCSTIQGNQTSDLKETNVHKHIQFYRSAFFVFFF